MVLKLGQKSAYIGGYLRGICICMDFNGPYFEPRYAGLNSLKDLDSGGSKINFNLIYDILQTSMGVTRDERVTISIVMSRDLGLVETVSCNMSHT